MRRLLITNLSHMRRSDCNLPLMDKILKNHCNSIKLGWFTGFFQFFLLNRFIPSRTENQFIFKHRKCSLRHLSDSVKNILAHGTDIHDNVTSHCVQNVLCLRNYIKSPCFPNISELCDVYTALFC